MREFTHLSLMKLTSILLLLSAITLSGCGVLPGAAAPTATPEPTATPASTPTAVSTAINSLDEVKAAVIQIESQGTFADPGEGMMFNVAGSGSGFIVDESGLAVTNNHVVTGAALIKVYVGGEDEPRNARVLGASECSDLAVIDIEGEDFPYLEWYDDEIKVGLDIFAAGFPLGDPEFTLTRGIVSKAQTSGETSWASVDAVLEHDATINPGNSGGPLVTQDGQVVGINYAGSSETSQYFAIARDEAIRIIERLQANEDITSIGINGEAFTSDDLSGIWVWSVKSGSPADEAGVQPGDVLTKLERLVLATDGTMTDYCDILRSRSPSDTLAVEVVRSETQQVLEGQLNGRELEESFSFAQAESVPQNEGDATSYESYQTLTDDTGAIEVEVPAAWIDTRGAAWVMDEEEIGVAVSAAPNVDEFSSTWTTPGMFLGASETLGQQMGPNELLDANAFNDTCTYDGREAYEDSLYIGFYDVWINCDGTDTALLVVAFEPEDASFLGLVQVQVVSEADIEALDRILDSFVVKR
jgi:serine protease Do